MAVAVLARPAGMAALVVLVRRRLRVIAVAAGQLSSRSGCSASVC